VVDVETEAQLLVERLGAVHVRDGQDHEFERHVHDDAPPVGVAVGGDRRFVRVVRRRAHTT
jgi:hypothetical protein